jgi:hypothetical protein
VFISEVKLLPNKVAFVYEYLDGKTGKINQKVIIVDSNISSDDMMLIEPSLEAHFGPQDKPKLIVKEPPTIIITHPD